MKEPMVLNVELKGAED